MHTFTYQKTLFRTLHCLFLKPLKAFSLSLIQGGMLVRGGFFQVPSRLYDTPCRPPCFLVTSFKNFYLDEKYFFPEFIFQRLNYVLCLIKVILHKDIKSASELCFHLYHVAWGYNTDITL